MCLGGPKMPPTQAPPKPIPVPQQQDPAVKKARARDRQVAALAQGRGSTVLTGALGLTGAAGSSAKKTALGA